MCGIYFYTKNCEINNDKMKFSMKHRGPDYSNQIDLPNSVIGHNLLSIRENIDLSIQPVTTANDKYILAFNGEIYNTEYLKTKFEINLKSESDTEILSKLINKIGLKFIEYIKGMYAIIVYEKKTETVYAYRDKSGQKNVYYFKKNENFIISSEIQAMLNSKFFDKNIDYRSVFEACKIGYNPNENTLFSNVKKLLPGEIITYKISEKKIIKKQFTQKKNNFDGANVFESIDQTIKNHLLSKKKIGLNISGGLDSNIILYHATKYKPNIDLFCTFFEGAPKEYNHDYDIACKVSNYYGLKIIKTNITKKDYINKFYDSFSLIEEPNRNIGNPGYYLNYINQSKLGFRSILTGDGGDEIFVGYPWYRKGRMRELIYSNKLFSKFIKWPEINNYYENYSRYDSLERNNKFFFNLSSKIKREIIELSKMNFDNYFKNSFFENHKNNWNIMKLILDQHNWLSSEVLIRADKLSMRESLEIRSPFCDHDLRTKILDEIDNSNFKSKINKSQIRSIYKDKLPEYIINEKKKFGWRCPREWINDPELKKQIIDIMPLKNSDFIDWKLIKNCLIKNEISLLDRSIAPILSLVILNDYYKVSI